MQGPRLRDLAPFYDRNAWRHPLWYFMCVIYAAGYVRGYWSARIWTWRRGPLIAYRHICVHCTRIWDHWYECDASCGIDTCAACETLQRRQP